MAIWANSSMINDIQPGSKAKNGGNSPEVKQQRIRINEGIDSRTRDDSNNLKKSETYKPDLLPLSPFTPFTLANETSN